LIPLEYRRLILATLAKQGHELAKSPLYDVLPEIEPHQPSYDELIAWRNDWPEAQTVLLDFWARGGYMNRLLWRRQNNATGLTIGVRYVDELDWVFRRLVLLGLDVDFVWHGDVSDECMVVCPQDADFEGAGGWGYTTCSGDHLNPRKSDREWVPAIGNAQLVPDTVADWLFENAKPFLQDGRVFLSPGTNIGVPKRHGNSAILEYESLSGSATICPMQRYFNVIDEIDLPYLDSMSVPDLYKFCNDHKHELERFQQQAKILFSGDGHSSEYAIKEMKDAIAELQTGSRTMAMRSFLTSMGTSLAFGSLALASDIGQTVLAGGTLAQHAMQWWFERTVNQRELQSRSLWPVWHFSRGKQKAKIIKRNFASELGFPPNMRAGDGPSHWLAPPSGGWWDPTVSRQFL
jgi:hypothetical protein